MAEDEKRKRIRKIIAAVVLTASAIFFLQIAKLYEKEDASAIEEKTQFEVDMERVAEAEKKDSDFAMSSLAKELHETMKSRAVVAGSFVFPFSTSLKTESGLTILYEANHEYNGRIAFCSDVPLNEVEVVWLRSNKFMTDDPPFAADEIHNQVIEIINGEEFYGDEYTCTVMPVASGWHTEEVWPIGQLMSREFDKLRHAGVFKNMIPE